MDLSEIFSFYNKNVRKHGNDFQALAWGSRESQFKRFEILAEAGDLNSASILDVGCGLGDFYSFLRERFTGITYTGIDLVPAMIETAKSTYPEAEFIAGNFLEADLAQNKYDYVFTSGIFNRELPGQKEFIEKAITAMFALCKKAIGFNMLSDRAEEQDEANYHANPETKLELCKKFSSKVVLRHEYMSHDFTIFVYRENPGD